MQGSSEQKMKKEASFITCPRCHYRCQKEWTACPMCNTALSNIVSPEPPSSKREEQRPEETISTEPYDHTRTKLEEALRESVKNDLLTIIKAMGIISMRTLAQQNGSNEATMLAIVEDLVDNGEVDGHVDPYTLEFVSEIKDEEEEPAPPGTRIKNGNTAQSKGVEQEIRSTPKKPVKETRLQEGVARKGPTIQEPSRKPTLAEMAAKKATPARNAAPAKAITRDPSLYNSRVDDLPLEIAPVKPVTKNSFPTEEPEIQSPLAENEAVNFTRENNVTSDRFAPEVDEATVESSLPGNTASSIAPVTETNDDIVDGAAKLARQDLETLHETVVASGNDAEKEVERPANKNQVIVDKDSLETLKEDMKRDEEAVGALKVQQDTLQGQVGSLNDATSEMRSIGADLLSEMTELRQLMNEHDQLEDNVEQIKNGIAQFDEKLLDLNIKDDLEKIEAFHRELESLHASLEGHVKQTDDALVKMNAAIEQILKNQAETSEKLNALARSQIKWSRSARASQRGHH